jgi:hypothetical protein
MFAEALSGGIAMRPASEWVWAPDGSPQERSRSATQHNFLEEVTAVTFDQEITYNG